MKTIRLIALSVILVGGCVFLSEPLRLSHATVTYAQTINWTKLSTPTTATLRSIHFLDANNGWAAGANGALLKTNNGGANWTAVDAGFAQDAGNDFRFIQFLNANVGWLGTSRGIARTTDGGANWVALGIGLIVNNATISPYNAFVPLSETQIRFAGTGIDNGLRIGAAITAELNVSNPAGAPRLFNLLPISPSNPALSRHVNDFSVVPGAGTWYVMDDGGAARTQGTGTTGFTGMSLTTPTSLYGVQMLNGNLGYAVGASGTILKGNGLSWTPQTSGATATLRDVYFLDEQRGWVVGDGGTILSTTNGGAQWKREESGTTENLNAVWAVNTSTVYVVGANGTILKQGSSAPAALASVSAASYSNVAVAPDSITAAFGANLSATTEIASIQPLPTMLAGVSVRVRDSAGSERNAPLFFVSPEQVNYLMPANTALGAATVSLINSSGTVVAQGNVNITRVAAGFFAANANGQGVPAGVVLRVRGDGTPSYEALARFDAGLSRWVAVPIEVGAANDQIFLVLFGTGFRSRSALSAVTARLGGADAEALYASEAPGLPGVDQLNLRLPRSLAGRGETEISIIVEGISANALRIQMQ